MFIKINLIFVFLFFLVIDCKKLRAKTKGCNAFDKKCGWFRSEWCSNFECSNKIAGTCCCPEGLVYDVTAGRCNSIIDMISRRHYPV